ncbi:WXG100 family type VII secretion target [Nocardia thailandica]
MARLAGLAGFVATNLDDVDDRVATLKGTSWEGIAADAYEVAHQQWMTAARTFAEGVGDMSDAAKAAHGRYTTAAEMNKRMLQSG